MKNLFILDHYYSIEHKDCCLIIESDRTVDEIIHICNSLTFLLEDMFDNSAVSLDMNCLLDVLVTYYGAVDKKAEFKYIVSLIDLPIENLYKTIKMFDFYVNTIYIVDLYEARKSCFGTNYKEIMNTCLPKGERLQQLMALLREKGVENMESYEKAVHVRMEDTYHEIIQDLDTYTKNPNAIAEKALPKLNKKQLEYCQLLSADIESSKREHSPEDSARDDGKLTGFLYCLNQMKIIDFIEVKALHKWFSEQDRSE